MLDTIDRTTKQAAGELQSSPTTSKRELIEATLREDPKKSDRAIAKALSVDHKTVGSVRAQIGVGNSPSGNPSASPDPVSLIARTLASNGLDPSDPALFPILTAAAHRKEKEFNPFDPNPADPDDLCLVAPERLGLACFVNTRNNVVIANGNERDGIDEMVQVNPADLPTLISRLREIQSEFADGEYSHDGARK